MGETEPLAFVILAAGEGTRMRSSQPKVLHPVCGRPIVGHAISAAQELGAVRTICVIGNEAQQVEQSLSDTGAEFAVQSERLGTGHAVLQTRELLAKHRGPVLVMNGDHPLFRPESFRLAVETWREQEADLALLVARYPDQSDFGRVVRGVDGRLERIVEYPDASQEIRELREVSLGVYVCSAELLFRTLDRVGNQNPKGEYYLTDIVALILDEGGSVATAEIEDWDEARGINTLVDLAAAERVMRRRIAERWMLSGVTFVDPDQTWVDSQVEIGPDSVIGPGVCLRGQTRLGNACHIDAGVVVESSTLGDGVWLKPHCHVERSRLGDQVIAGPSAHLRPDTVLCDEVRVGNFVEIKNSTLGRGTKADHLSYIGDADVGSGVTFACGAITVNYDGKQKQRTTVGDGAFIGCNVNLIAPVEIEAEAYVAAGSTITTRVPSRALAVARARQRVIEGWWNKHFGKGDEQD